MLENTSTQILTSSPSTALGSNLLSTPARESWYVRANDLVNQRAFLLEFTILLSANGFRRVAKIRAVSFQRLSAAAVNKTAIEQIFDLSSFRRGAASSTSAVGLAAQSPQPISINDCTWSESGSRGSVSNARQSFEWDLQFKPEDTGQRAPEKSGTWVKLGQRLPRGASAAIKRQLWSADPSLIDLRVSGTFRVNGEIFSLSEAPGAIGHTSGGRLPHTWVWSQGSAFLNERGTRVGFAFEGMALRERLFGKLAGPSATNLYFLYQDQPYFFHSAQSPLTVRSEVSLSSWSFSAEAGDLTFRGESRADFRDFAGMTLEDTNGSFIHLATTLVSDIEIRVYRRSKIEAAFYANGIGTLEFAERSKNPYVPKLI